MAAKTTNVTFRMPPELLRRLRKNAKERGTTPNVVVIQAVERFISGTARSPFEAMREAAVRGGIRSDVGGWLHNRDELHERDDE